MSIAAFIKQYQERNKVASVDQRISLAAQRGAAMAKEAMSDVDFIPVAMSMSKEAALDWRRIGTNALEGTAAMALTAGVVGAANLGVQAVQSAYRSLTEGRTKAKGFAEMLRVNPQLGQNDHLKVQRAYNTLHRFNPEMAQDPLVAGSFVQRAVDYGGVTQDEMSKVIAARKHMAEAAEKESPSSFRAGPLASHEYYQPFPRSPEEHGNV